ncbi:hypothetical protein [Aquabacter cavernae]|uniref:hypothetical protein n=1 Tax=Aquabacter cavernae TaxID=2496029 RepID=UPI000F8D0448|nr:hypothetical protein [Aquabacter cavernae]
MTRETVYVVQAFQAGKGQRLVADTPISCKSAPAAQRTAERLALLRIGVVAFSTSGDAETGDYDDEPVVLFKTGRLPSQFEDG